MTKKQLEIFDTLATAKADLWNEMKIDGMDCPCCGRFAKLYRYTISKAQAAAFNWIVLASDEGHMFAAVQELAPKWLLRSNSHGKLALWGLLETKLSDDPGVHCPGLWRPTEYGMQWWRGEITVPKYALVFDSKVHGFAGPDIWFGSRFDPFHFAELMGARATDVLGEQL